MVSGSRDGFVCAKTSSSRRLRVSPRKASCSKTMGKVALSSIGFGQSVPGDFGQYAGRLDNQQICSPLAWLSHGLGISRIVADHLAVADTQTALARPWRWIPCSLDYQPHISLRRELRDGRRVAKQQDRSSICKQLDDMEASISFILFFFLWYGWSHSKARSLHVKKQFEIKSTLTPVVM